MHAVPRTVPRTSMRRSRSPRPGTRSAMRLSTKPSSSGTIASRSSSGTASGGTWRLVSQPGGRLATRVAARFSTAHQIGTV